MSVSTRNKEIVEALDRLIRTNRNSEEGFYEAADGLGKSESSHVLRQFAQQRAQFAGDLEQEVRSYGGEYPLGPTIAGPLRNGWVNIKAAVIGGEEDGILAECENAEKVTMADYEETLQGELPEYLKETLRQQFEEIREDLQHIRALRKVSVHH